MSEDDYPFDEIVAQAAKLIEGGASLLQKFTCSGCGQRLTMDVPNVFYIEGGCDKCDTITNIKEQGCNYLLYIGNPDALDRALKEEQE